MEEPEMSEPRACFICGMITSFLYAENYIEIKSQHSKSSISELILEIIGDEQTFHDEAVIKKDCRCLCRKCICKINEYDLACVTVKRVGNELRQMLLHTDLIGVKNSTPIVDEVFIELDTVVDKLNCSKNKNKNELVTKVETDSYDIHESHNYKETNIKTTIEENPNKHETLSEDEIVSKTLTAKYISIDAINSNYKRTYECQHCLLKFKSAKDLKKHRAKHRNDDNQFRCDICNFHPKDEIALAEHKKLHVGLSPLQCVVCKKTFIHKRNINPHMRLHTGQKKYQCDRCGKEYFHKSSFSLHMSYHIGARREKCPHCTRQFVVKTDLEKHMRTHTGEKPYPCGICGKRFARRDNMKEHQKIHDKRHIEKPFSCSFCDVAFSRRSTLNKHLEKHGVMSFRKDLSECLDYRIAGHT